MRKRLTGKNATKDGEQDQTSLSEAEEALKDHFRHAVFGDFCRTQTYRPAHASIVIQKEWLEAYHVPRAGWFVIRKEWRANDTTQLNEPSITQKPYPTAKTDKAVSFFDAIELLSQYETTPLNLEPLDPDEISELGHKHYTSFAEREAIAFDKAGLPHPTVNGNIHAVKASFSEDAYTKAEEANKSKQTSFHGFPQILLPLKQFSSAPSFYKEYETAGEIIRALKWLKDHVKTALKTGLEKDSDLDEQHYSGYFNSFGEICDIAWKEIQNSLGTKQEDKEEAANTQQGTAEEAVTMQFYRAAVLFEFYAWKAIACKFHYGLNHYDYTISENDEEVYTEERLETAVEAAIVRLEDIGYTAEEGRGLVEREVLKTTDDNIDLAELDQIIDWFDSVRQDFLKKSDVDIQEYQNKTTKLPSPGL